MNECKSPQHKRKAPLLTTFCWRFCCYALLAQLCGNADCTYPHFSTICHKRKAAILFTKCFTGKSI